jgi:hypothetical protein
LTGCFSLVSVSNLEPIGVHGNPFRECYRWRRWDKIVTSVQPDEADSMGDQDTHGDEHKKIMITFAPLDGAG